MRVQQRVIDMAYVEGRCSSSDVLQGWWMRMRIKIRMMSCTDDG